MGLGEFLVDMRHVCTAAAVKLNDARHDQSNPFVSWHGFELFIGHPSHSHSPFTKTSKLGKEQQVHAESEDACTHHKSEGGGDEEQERHAKRARAE
jgi:hypothetical protein